VNVATVPLSRPGLAVPTAEEADAVRVLLAATSVHRVEAELRISRGVLLRVAGGAGVRKGSLLLLRQALAARTSGTGVPVGRVGVPEGDSHG
jgi:hypothetical protein